MTRDDPAGLPPGFMAKIAAILSFLAAAPGVDALKAGRSWKAHTLSGDRKGNWSFSVTRNWRITFRIDEGGAIADLDFEDYH